MVGTRLRHYEIQSALGKGGMGEVWRARDTKLGREVAIKTLPAEFAADADRLARFEREARLLASLNHPHIAAIHGLEEHDGTRFLVLELVEGPTLADRIGQGAIPVEEALGLALQIAGALEAADDKGVIHRDLKPANIKLTKDGQVKVLDFGLAKAYAGPGPEASASQSPTLSMAATQQGLILGTAAYMSPEQARGRELDRRTDIWAFGCVLFEMLAGHPAFPGDDVTDILAAVVRAEPAWGDLPGDLNPRVRELLERYYLESGHVRFVRDGSLWVAPFDLESLSAGTPVSLPLEVTFDTRLAHDPTPQLAVSRSGTLVYATGPGAAGRSGRLVWVDRSGTVLEDLGLAPGRLPCLELSPDETRLALEYREGADVVVAIYDMTRRLVETELVRKRQIFRGMAVWTPDGSRLAVSRPGIVRSTMSLIDVAGGGGVSELFTTAGSWLFPFSFSSDGRRLLYNLDVPERAMGIGVYEFGDGAEPGTARMLLDSPALESAPSWSPAGGAFAYVKDTDGEENVWLRPWPEGVERRVSADARAPLWSRDGTVLFYTRDFGSQVWAVPVTMEPDIRPGEARMLFEGSYQMSGDAGLGYDVSNDGERFLMVQTNPEEWVVDELVVVLNWFEELRGLAPVEY